MKGPQSYMYTFKFASINMVRSLLNSVGSITGISSLLDLMIRYRTKIATSRNAPALSRIGDIEACSIMVAMMWVETSKIRR
jgi:hypothetical protein